MADIELVIKIPEEEYNIIKKSNAPMSWAEHLIAKGTVLPKGHGRILDEKDILDTDNNDGIYYDIVDMPEYIAGIKPIIESDNKYEAKWITHGNCMMCGKELTEGLFFCKKCENKGNSRK